MSEELFLIAPANIDVSVQQQVFSCLESKGEFYLINAEALAAGLERTYSFSQKPRDYWPEDFKVTIVENEVYLCFYSATGQQREGVCSLLTGCLRDIGIMGAFEEH